MSKKTKYDEGDSGLPMPPQYDAALIMELMDAMYSRLNSCDINVNNTCTAAMEVIRRIQSGAPSSPADRVNIWWRGTAYRRFLVKAFPRMHRIWTYVRHPAESEDW